MKTANTVPLIFLIIIILAIIGILMPCTPELLYFEQNSGSTYKCNQYPLILVASIIGGLISLKSARYEDV